MAIEVSTGESEYALGLKDDLGPGIVEFENGVRFVIADQKVCDLGGGPVHCPAGRHPESPAAKAAEVLKRSKNTFLFE